MISLKRSIDDLAVMERHFQAAIQCYLSLVSCVGAHPVDVQPDLVCQFRNRLKLLRRSLGAQPDPEALSGTGSLVEAEIRQFAAQAAKLLTGREAEVKNIIEILAEAAAALNAQNQSHNSRLSHFTKELERISRIPSLEEIRKKLADEVRDLKTFVATIGDEQRLSVDQLRTELGTFRSKLEEAERLAFSDSLTGIANRAEGDKQLNACAASGRPFSVLVWDLNRFKQINDRWGHQAGDFVLRTFASKLAQNVRAGDTVCRWGGDEFLVVLPGCRLGTALDRAKNLSGSCCGTYQLPVNGHQQLLPVSAAVGVAEYVLGESLEDLMARADKFLYREKEVPSLR